MLLCNNVRVDISADDRIAKWVKACQDTLIEDYRLHKGGFVTLSFANRLIKTEKTVDGVKQVIVRKIKPASVVIDHYENYFNEKMKELQEWRYCETKMDKLGERSKFYPPSTIFEGTKSLYMKDIDLIFFLMYISIRVENGKNPDTSKKKFLRFEDKLEDAKIWRQKEIDKAWIKNCIIGTVHTGGVSDEDIRNIAASLVMPNARNENIPIDFLRKELYDMVTKDESTHQRVAELIGTVKGQGVQIMGNIAEAKELKLITIRKIGPVPFWIYLHKDSSTADKIVKIPAGVSSPEDHLKEFYLSNPEDYTHLIDSLTQLKKFLADKK